jgi:hypothetical protein
MEELDYWTIEALENAGEKDIAVEGKKFRIKAVDAKVLITLFQSKDGKLPEMDKEMEFNEILKNLEVLDDVILKGLVKPAVTKDKLHVIGRFKNGVAQEILAFSGLGKKDSKVVDEFR